MKRRMWYGLLAAAVVVCSAGAGVLTWQVTGTPASEPAQKKEPDKHLVACEYPSWYMPLSEDLYGVQEIQGADRELYAARVEEKEVILDREGNTIFAMPEGVTVVDKDPWMGDLSPEFFESEETDRGNGDNLIQFQDKETGKLGYMDLEGNIVIPARFDHGTAFQNGRAVVEEAKEGEEAVQFPIDRTGKKLYDTEKVDKEGDRYTHVRRLNETCFFLEHQSKKLYRVFDTETGQVIKTFDDSNWITLTDEGEGYCGKYTEAQFQLLDADFNPISEPLFMGWADRFSEGLCYVNWKEDGKTKRGYMDTSGQIKIDLPSGFHGGRFSEGKALVYGKDEIRCIDQNGQTLFTLPLKLKMDVSALYYSSADTTPIVELTKCWFRNGYALCYDGESFGLIDEAGNWIMEPVLIRAEFTGEDAAVATLFEEKDLLLEAGLMKVGE